MSTMLRSIIMIAVSISIMQMFPSKARSVRLNTIEKFGVRDTFPSESFKK